jgi:predicted methyltransferase
LDNENANINGCNLNLKASVVVNIHELLFYSEVMRVLKPGGLFLFVEHVASEGKKMNI